MWDLFITPKTNKNIKYMEIVTQIIITSNTLLDIKDGKETTTEDIFFVKIVAPTTDIIGFATHKNTLGFTRLKVIKRVILSVAFISSVKYTVII